VNRRILITGASGFVGRHLAERLDRPGNLVFGTSYPHRPEQLRIPCRGDICYLDIRRRERLEPYIERIRPDWIIHLAAVSSVGLSWTRRQETLETNLMGSLHLLESVRKTASGARILMISSADVYGAEGVDEEPIRETHPVHAASPYAVSKISGELLAGFYAEVEGLDVVLARPFPHTGPGQEPDFVCSDWARQIARIEKGAAAPEIRVGNLDVARDFTDVRDVVEAYLLLLEKGGRGEIYNIASGEAAPLRRIMELLLERTGASIEVRVDPEKFRKTDIPILTGDSTKLRGDTGWAPEIPLGRTLGDLLDDWRERA
jgi:GDP-4-dehydro-6-deoxy-D-mannose reductase